MGMFVHTLIIMPGLNERGLQSKLLIHHLVSEAIINIIILWVRCSQKFVTIHYSGLIV